MEGRGIRKVPRNDVFYMSRALLFCISAARMNRRREGALVWLIHPDQESTGRCGLLPGEGRHNIGGLVFSYASRVWPIGQNKQCEFLHNSPLRPAISSDLLESAEMACFTNMAINKEKVHSFQPGRQLTSTARVSISTLAIDGD